MIAVLDLNAELAKLAHFARTPTSPEAERKKGLATLAPYRDGGIFTSKFSGTGGWERHPNGDEIVHILEGATCCVRSPTTGRRSRSFARE